MARPRRILPSITVAAVIAVGAALLLIPRPERRHTPLTETASDGEAIRTVEDGVLTVGSVPVPPFSEPGAEGPQGFDVDLAAEVARRLGLRPRLVDAEGDPFAGLVTGDVDVVLAAAPITDELEERVNLSDPYVRLHQALVVNVDVRPDLAGTEGLVEGDDVAVIAGSTGQAWATSHLEPSAIDVQPYPSVEGAAVVLAAGVVDALITDEVSAMTATASRESLRITETIATGEGLGIAVDPHNAALLQAVNAALEEIMADGTYDRLYDRYEDILPPGGRITAS